MQRLTSKLPLSRQTQRYLRGLIDDGSYQPGDQLPSEEELAAQLGISRPTLREALRGLEQEGIIVRKHGVGTFVTENNGHRLESGLERLQSILELAAGQGLEARIDGLEVQEEPAGQKVAGYLDIAPGTPLTAIRRAIKVGRRPVAFMLDVVPTSILAPSDVRDFNGSVLDLLRRHDQCQIDRAVADIVATTADPFLAGKLQVEQGRPVLLIEEIVFDREGTPIEFSRNYFIPDFFRFHVVRR